MPIKLRDYFKLSNIRDFVEGKWNMAKQHSSFLRLEEHIREQAIYRALLCSECHQNGECLICGCSTPDMFYAPKKECPDGAWTKMLDKSEWEKFKLENEIDDIDTLDIDTLSKFKTDDLEGLPEWLRRKMLEEDAKRLAVRSNTENFPEDKTKQ